jgi:uncharacterized protein
VLILIDGYNVIAPLGRQAIERLPPNRRPSTDQLRLQRDRLIAQVAAGLGPELAEQTTIVFDASDAPPGLPSRYTQQGISIEFSVGYAEADDRLEELIAQHHTPKRLTVVSSDRRVQTAATRRGALSVDSEPWLDQLADGRPRLAIAWPTSPADASAELSEKPEIEIDSKTWLQAFQEDEVKEETPDKPPRTWNPFPEGYGEDLL